MPNHFAMAEMKIVHARFDSKSKRPTQAANVMDTYARHIYL